jgi:hypothetical protein
MALLFNNKQHGHRGTVNIEGVRSIFAVLFSLSKKLTIATSMSEIPFYSNLSAVIFSLGYRVDPLIQKHRLILTDFDGSIVIYNKSLQP